MSKSFFDFTLVGKLRWTPLPQSRFDCCVPLLIQTRYYLSWLPPRLSPFCHQNTSHPDLPHRYLQSPSPKYENSYSTIIFFRQTTPVFISGDNLRQAVVSPPSKLRSKAISYYALWSRYHSVHRKQASLCSVSLVAMPRMGNVRHADPGQRTATHQTQIHQATIQP